MSRILLISCVSKKWEKKAKAKDLYISPLFKLNLKYAQSLDPDNIFILSAKYGLLDLEKEISPYNKTLSNMNKEQRIVWSNKVLKQLKGKADLQQDQFIFLAGANYRKFLVPHLNHVQVPMKNLGIGKQLKFLKEAIK